MGLRKVDRVTISLNHRPLIIEGQSMQEMNLRSEVLTLIKEERDNDLLAAIRELLLRKDSDWWDRIGTAERASIKRGVAEADAGMGVSHQEAMKPYGKWL